MVPLHDVVVMPMSIVDDASDLPTTQLRFVGSCFCVVAVVDVVVVGDV
jgi:uncharacterized protein YjeT (DUF2065 family)